MSVMHLEWFSAQDIVCIEKLTLVLFKMCSSLVNKCWTVDPRYSFQSFLITFKGYKINLSLLQ